MTLEEIYDFALQYPEPEGIWDIFKKYTSVKIDFINKMINKGIPKDHILKKLKYEFSVEKLKLWERKGLIDEYKVNLSKFDDYGEISRKGLSNSNLFGVNDNRF